MKAFITLGGRNPNLPEFTPEFIFGREDLNPKSSYVYGHYDEQGRIFYVGKGVRKRAWDKENRHPLWERYVAKNLNGNYQIRIIEDDLTNEDAEYLEDQIMRDFSEQLINWINWGRKSNFAALQEFHNQRNANRALINKAKSLEVTNIDDAINQYRFAIENIKDYAFTQLEDGLLGQIIREENEDIGYSGELEALDRLTLCLCKQNRASEAFDDSVRYFKTYKRDLLLSSAKKIIQRIEKRSGKQFVG